MSELDNALAIIDKYNGARKLDRYNKDKFLIDLEQYSNNLNLLIKNGLKRDVAINKLKLQGKSQPVEPVKNLTPDLINNFKLAKEIILKYGGKVGMTDGDNIVAYMPNGANLNPVITKSVTLSPKPPENVIQPSIISTGQSTSQSTQQNYINTQTTSDNSNLPWPYGSGTTTQNTVPAETGKGANLILWGMAFGALLWFIRRNRGS